MSGLRRRISTWTLCRLLSIRCVFTGHNYGTHFSDLTRVWDWGEKPWCDRCGWEADE